MAKNGEVTLTGAVRCGTERAAAEEMLADLTGVRTVTDDIQIRDDANPLHPRHWCEWAHASGAARAVWVSDCDPHDPGCSAAPGRVRAALPVLLLSQQVVGVGLDEQRHEHGVHDVPPVVLAFHAATGSRTWVGQCGGIPRPPGRITPMSSNTITPLHSRLHPCSG